jgi:hypothetical protein
MLAPVKVATDLSNGNSAVFNAQWYPFVVAQLTLSYGTSCTIIVKMQASLDNSHWVDIVSDTFSNGDGATVSLVKPAGEWWLYYRLNITVDKVATFVTDAWMGAGGS